MRTQPALFNTYQQAVMEKTQMDAFHLRNQSHFREPPEAKTIAEERAKFRWFVDSGMLSNQLIRLSPRLGLNTQTESACGFALHIRRKRRRNDHADANPAWEYWQRQIRPA